MISPQRTTIAMLHPGEMGSCLGAMLRAQGHRVIASVAARSRRTQQLCGEAAMESVDSIEELAEAAEIVFSVVPPSAAMTVADQYVRAAETCHRRATYVDVNAISPNTAQDIAARLEGAGHRFVDASIHGLASRLPTAGTLYLSGREAGEIASLFPATLQVKVLGDAPDGASAMKMLLGGLNKGLIGLFLELSILAEEMGVLDQLLGVYRAAYPGVMDVVDRLLPTYPRHARRRAEELGELEKTMRSFGLLPQTVSGARRTIEMLGRLGFAESAKTAQPGKTALPRLVRSFHQQDFLGQRG